MIFSRIGNDKMGVLEICLKTRRNRPFYHRRKTMGGELITTAFKESAKLMRRKDAVRLTEDYVRKYGIDNITHIKFNMDV